MFLHEKNPEIAEIKKGFNMTIGRAFLLTFTTSEPA